MKHRPADAVPAETHVSSEIAHGRPFISCRFDPGGRYVYAGAEDYQVWRFPLEGGEKTSLSTEAWVRALGFSDDQTLITGGFDGKLMWWSLVEESPVVKRSVDAHQGWIRALDLSSDRQLLATCGNDKAVRIWQIESGELLHEFTGFEHHAYHVAFHPDGAQVVAGDLTARFLHWDLTDGRQVREFKIEALHKYDNGFKADYGGPYAMQFNAEGTQLAAAGITNVTNAFAGVGNPAVSMIDWETATQSALHLSKNAIRGKVWGLELHSQGFVVAAVGGGGGGHFFWWNPGEEHELHTLNLGNTARDMDLHPDGLRLVTAHHDGKLRISTMSAAPPTE